ncbi:MAG: GDYXXLXY domain-containing protein [Bacteroidales bacterium]|jgi:uncharacterized membrane-anchored protein|nr:GDYXXLXY domain-containing protein [Bacteroidales bacterium]
MQKKKIIILVFILVALTQLYIPASMIWEKEDIIESGTEFKFRTAPVDPSDPFRGKYITLNYKDNTFKCTDESLWKKGDKAFVSLITDKDGFAKIGDVSKHKPEDNNSYLKAKIGHVTQDGSNMLTIEYPFNRFYMEESKAELAEILYQMVQRDSSATTYALVVIKKGNAVLKDVLIDEVSIVDKVEETAE